MDAAAHSGGVVGDDAADHTAADRGGVGAEFAAVAGQEPVDLAADDAGLQGDCGVFVVPDPLPILAGDQEDAVGDGLTGECGAGGPEGDGDAILRGGREDGRDIGLVSSPYDRLGDKPVLPGIRSPRQPLDKACQNPLLGHRLPNILKKSHISFHCLPPQS